MAIDAADYSNLFPEPPSAEELDDMSEGQFFEATENYRKKMRMAQMLMDMAAETHEFLTKAESQRSEAVLSSIRQISTS